jgi:predicted transposase/invertase (TIGR01784 family)
MTMADLIRFDWAIKNLLRNKANFDVLEGFLSELLKTQIHIDKILESESNQDHAEDKFNRVDLLVKTAEGQYIIIELQCSGQWDYLSRILYGTSKVVCEQLKVGDAYRKIQKVISVSIVFFNLGHGKDYLYRGSTSFKGLHFQDTLELNEKEREAYTGLNQPSHQTPESVFPEYYIIKVAQFHERVRDKVDEWIYFFKSGKIEPTFQAQGIQSAANKLDILRLSEEERRMYKRYEDSLHDDASFTDMLTISEQKGREEGREEGIGIGLEKGREEGMGIGLEKGREEGIGIGVKKGELKAKQALARKLLAKKLTLEEVSALTELPLTEIKSLFAE